MRRMFWMTLVVLMCAAPVAAQGTGSTIWGGAGWTTGMFAATNLSGTCEQVAALDANGIVRITEDNCTTLLPMVQAHILLPVAPHVSVGPAVGVALGEGLIEQVGLSLAVGFQVDDRKMVVSLGFWGQPHAQILQPQFVAGRPAPTSEGVPLPPAYVSTTNFRTAVGLTFEVF